MDKPQTPHDTELDAREHAVFDAFAAYWRERESAKAEQLWAAYCALEDQLDDVLSRATAHTQRAH